MEIYTLVHGRFIHRLGNNRLQPTTNFNGPKALLGVSISSVAGIHD